MTFSTPSIWLPTLLQMNINDFTVQLLLIPFINCELMQTYNKILRSHEKLIYVQEYLGCTTMHSPPMHLFFATYLGLGHGCNSLSRHPQTSQGIHKPAERYNLSSWSWVCLETSSSTLWNVWKSSIWRLLEDILSSCPNDLNQLLSMWKSCNCSEPILDDLNFSLFP